MKEFLNQLLISTIHRILILKKTLIVTEPRQSRITKTSEELRTFLVKKIILTVLVISFKAVRQPSPETYFLCAVETPLKVYTKKYREKEQQSISCSKRTKN